MSAPAIGLPSVERRAPHPAGCPARQSRGRRRSRRRRARDEERPEHGRLGGPAGVAVVDADDLHREAEHVGEQNELLALVVGDVARAGEEVDPGEPLLLGERTSAAKAWRWRTRVCRISRARIGRAVELASTARVRSASARLRRSGACVAGGSVASGPWRGLRGVSSAAARFRRASGSRQPANAVSSSRAERQQRPLVRRGGR